LATLPAANRWWRFARQDRPPILRYHWSSGVFRETVRKWLRGRGKQIEIAGDSQSAECRRQIAETRRVTFSRSSRLSAPCFVSY
jgi:hypothetical protein